MRFLIRLMVVFVIVMVVMSALRGLLARKDPSVQQKRAGKVRSGKLLKDPICGTYVTAEESLSATRESQTFYFCSEECKEQFVRSPNPQS